MFIRTTAAEYSGPHRTGGIDAPFAAMVAALGEPHRSTEPGYPDDDYKTDVCWMVRSIETPGSVVTIWNYKNGPNYTGAGTVDDIDSYSVYTNDPAFFDEVIGAINAMPVDQATDEPDPAQRLADAQDRADAAHELIEQLRAALDETADALGRMIHLAECNTQPGPNTMAQVLRVLKNANKLLQ